MGSCREGGEVRWEESQGEHAIAAARVEAWLFGWGCNGGTLGLARMGFVFVFVCQRRKYREDWALGWVRSEPNCRTDVVWLLKFQIDPNSKLVQNRI